MQIIIKERPDGKQCLFDTRSEEFLDRCCVRDGGDYLLEIANSIARKQFSKIVELADSNVYEDGSGYLLPMIAQAYLKINPDIRDKAIESKDRIKINVDKRMVLGEKKRRGRKPNSDSVPKVQKLDENGQPRKRGRPKKIVN